MSELFELYKKGHPIRELLQSIRKTNSVTTTKPGEPRSIADRVTALNFQMSEIQDIWASVRQPQPQHEKDRYDSDVAELQKAIAHLELLAKEALIDYCTQGLLIGIGFIDTFPPSFAVIHPNEWAFLKVNFEESSASYTHENYRKIKLVRTTQLMEEDMQLLVETSSEQIAIKATKTHPPQPTSPQIVQNYHTGDNYHIQQAAAVGPQATANNTSIAQINSTNFINNEELAKQLSALRNEMRKKAITAEHDESLGAVAAAEKAVHENNTITAGTHLKKAGVWALSIAKELGIGLAIIAIEKALTE